MPPLLLTNIAQLVTLAAAHSGDDAGPRRGRAMSELGLIRDAAILCAGGRIVFAGTERQVLRHSWYRENKATLKELDCRGMTVVPGFVDSHTHPVFAAPRLVDFEKRLAGASYQEIAAAGGGIRSSVAAVRKATRHTLSGAVTQAFDRMLAQGTTTVEAKSGYGLSFAAEIKSLEAIRLAAGNWPGTVLATLLGAHVVPAGVRREAYLKEVCGKMIPAAARHKLAQFVDVFCDRSAFSPEEAQQVFAAAALHGLTPRAHVGQFTPCALGPLLQHAPASFDHMDHFHRSDLPGLKKSQTVATLLPGANYFLGHSRYANARALIAAGVPVALATDYNPGTSPTASMPFVLSLACTQMKMSPAEAISAATINGAHALRLAGRKGSIAVGKDADLAVFDVRDYREIAYWFATDLCAQVVVNGSPVWK